MRTAHYYAIVPDVPFSSVEMPQIVVENLSKSYRIAERTGGGFAAVAGFIRPRYRTVEALNGVSFSVKPGEFVGYIGPNGAGKSTTVKVLSGILVPDKGKCEVGGRVPWRDRVQHVSRIGVVFGQRTQLWWDLPVIASFELLRDIYRVSRDKYTSALDELIEQLNLTTLLDVPVRQLSLGQRMRCDLAASLLHSPEILFLDEPTIGLDSVSKLSVRSFLKRINRERGVTVILTTHDMDDIEALCSRVIMIAEGRILSDGTVDDLRSLVTSERWMIVDLVDPDVEIRDPSVRLVHSEGDRITLAFDPNVTTTAEVVGRIIGKYKVRDLFVQDPSIEEIVAKLYGRHAGS